MTKEKHDLYIWLDQVNELIQQASGPAQIAALEAQAEEIQKRIDSI